MKKPSLNPLRQQLKVLVNQANQRVRELEKEGIYNSRALDEARRTLKKQSSRVDDNELFKSNLKSRRQINREFERVHLFLNDFTSTTIGANTIQIESSNLAGAFGGKWKIETGENYDTSRIDKASADIAFDLYRRVVEAAGGWERAIGILQGKESLIGYGSENLINSIYDMVTHNYSEEDIITTGVHLVNQGLEAYEEMAKNQVKNYDYGVIFDDEDAKNRRSWYQWRRGYKNANRMDRV